MPRLSSLLCQAPKIIHDLWWPFLNSSPYTHPSAEVDWNDCLIYWCRILAWVRWMYESLIYVLSQTYTVMIKMTACCWGNPFFDLLIPWKGQRAGGQDVFMKGGLMLSPGVSFQHHSVKQLAAWITGRFLNCPANSDFENKWILGTALPQPFECPGCHVGEFMS